MNSELNHRLILAIDRVQNSPLRINLGKYLRGRTYSRIFTSPLQRARRTCELAGLD